MNDNELTDLYAGYITPVRDGVYYRQGFGYAQFKHGQWHLAHSTIQGASKEHRLSLNQVSGCAPMWLGRAKP